MFQRRLGRDKFYNVEKGLSTVSARVGTAPRVILPLGMRLQLLAMTLIKRVDFCPAATAFHTAPATAVVVSAVVEIEHPLKSSMPKTRQTSSKNYAS
jgi:hypothetical protein